MATIRTPDQRVRIFVSSTLQELADERAAAKHEIQRMRLTPVMFEMGARAHPPRDLYRAYLAQSDVFIGIYWKRYGWVAPGETISGLEDEYGLAQGMPKLIYIKRAETREEAALARSRSAAWPRCFALFCLCSATVAAGDRADARALLEESLHYSTGAGLIAVDPVCGTLALMLAQEGERERALRVFAAVRPGAEDATGLNAHLTDPTGALRQATREARRVLGDPPAVDAETLDFASVLQAVLGDRGAR